MRINHNIQALNAYRNLSQNQNVVSKHLERLSSGLRINRAADDAAGLAISEKMRSQIRGLAMAERNTMDGISLMQTAEGALGTTHDILQRMRELAVQASNGTLAEQDREAIQNEIDQLTQEIDRIAKTTQFNAKLLLRGALEAQPFFSVDPTIIQYDPVNERWQGMIAAEPTEPAGFDLDLVNSVGDGAAMDGMTFEINGKVYELDSDGTSTGIPIDVSGIGASSTDAAGANRLNDIATRIMDTINANDSKVKVTLDPAVFDTATTTVSDAHLKIRTIDPAAPIDVIGYGPVNYDTSHGEAANFSFKDLNSAPLSSGQFFDVNVDSATPKSIKLKMSQPPKIGDSMTIDDVIISFAAPAASYDSATKLAVIDPTGLTISEILEQINTAIADAKAAGDGAAIGDDHQVLGNSLVLSTTKVDDGGVFGSNSALEIEIVDSDFAINVGKELVLDMQVGANAGEEMSLSFGVMDAASLGLARQADHKTVIDTAGVDAVAGIDVSSTDTAHAAITAIDAAIKKVSEERSKLGAYQNRMEYTASNLGIAQENLTAAESRIRDADMAMEMTNFTKNNIINQAATAMLAQANQLPQGILQLLK